MLGRRVTDPAGIEGRPGDYAEGLGLLEVETVLDTAKTVRSVRGIHVVSGCELNGYEIHMGQTNGPDCARPFANVAGQSEGSCSADGQIAGTYLHGIFAADAFRDAFLATYGAQSDVAYEAIIDVAIDKIANHLRRHLDTARILEIARTEDLDC